MLAALNLSLPSPARSPARRAGLNGSGKSNVLDAICFVLGITNLSQVRAGSLQDLVYKQVRRPSSRLLRRSRRAKPALRSTAARGCPTPPPPPSLPFFLALRRARAA